MQFIIMRHPAAKYGESLDCQIQLPKRSDLRHCRQRISYPGALQQFQMHAMLMLG